MVTDGFTHMNANEFNMALIEHRVTGGTFVYYTGWLPDAKRRLGGGDIRVLHLGRRDGVGSADEEAGLFDAAMSAPGERA